MSQSLNYRAEQAGMLVAGAGVPIGFQRTLMPRASMDQALVTGLSIATTEALVSFIQEGIQSGALLLLGQGRRHEIDERKWSRATLTLDAAAFASGLLVQRALRQRQREPLGRAALRTGAFFVSVSAAAGGVIGGLQESLHRIGPKRSRLAVPVVVPAMGAFAAAGEIRRRRLERANGALPDEEAHVAVAKSLLLGAGVTAGAAAASLVERRIADRIAGVTARVLPGNDALWRPVAHAASLALLGSGMRALVRRALGQLETREESVEAAFDLEPPTPTVSGSRESFVPFDTMARQGRRYVWTVTTPDRIELVMGEPAKAMPVRVYVGLRSAPTEQERVDLAMRELERTNAFDRSHLMLVSPTGTGYVNYAAISALEFLTRGDCATVAMQYAARPSVLSLDRVSEGRSHARMLVDAIHARLADRPAGGKPTVILFGESLGAWTSQDAFVDRGTRGLEQQGIDYAIWIGTPHFSEWKEQVLYDDRGDVDAAVLGVFNDIDEFHALDHAQRERLRYVMITHHDDGVARFGPQLAIQAPEWLRDPKSRPSGVPKGMRWVPPTTFVQVLVDMKNSATVVPGVFEAKGHDYRADLLPFFAALLGLDATSEQLQRIGAALEQTELRRSRWITAHGSAGRSLSAAIATRWMDQERAAGRDADALLIDAVQTLIAELDEAGDPAPSPARPQR
jgi:uncharacterized membrane protein